MIETASSSPGVWPLRQGLIECYIEELESHKEETKQANIA